MKTKKIFTRKLALELRKLGFPILYTEPNRYKPNFDVYIFPESEALEQAISSIQNSIPNALEVRLLPNQ